MIGRLNIDQQRSSVTGNAVRVPYESFCVRVTGVVSHVVCAFYFTGRDLRPCLPSSPTYTTSLIVSPRSWSRCSSLATPVFIWSKPTTRQSVNVSTCSPTTAWRIMFPPKLTTYIGGLLDVVASRGDLRPPSVEVIDVGQSDHRLLRWPVSKRRPTPVCTTTVVRPWCQLDAAAFRATVCRRRYCANRRPGTSVRLGRFVSAPMTSNQKVRPRPLDIHRQRHVQEDPCVADRVQLFCIPASHTQHPSLRLKARD